jgi:hypothetical protein
MQMVQFVRTAERVVVGAFDGPDEPQIASSHDRLEKSCRSRWISSRCLAFVAFSSLR